MIIIHQILVDEWFLFMLLTNKKCVLKIIALRLFFRKSEITVGYNYMYQNLDSNGQNSNGDLVDGIDNFRYVKGP